jgi:anti-anti-sigma regulatory factor
MDRMCELPAELTIYAVGALREEWAGQLGEHGDLVVDAARVDQVDAAGVQWLVALSHALARRERRLRLVDASRPLAAACLALGVGHLVETVESVENTR